LKFDQDIIERILNLSNEFNKIYIIDQNINYLSIIAPDTFFYKDNKEYFNQSSNPEILIAYTQFYLKFYDSFTEIEFSTNSLFYEEFNEILKIMQCPDDELPLLLGTIKNKEAKLFLDKRIKDIS
jgi:hypothetical protein